jgi:hypothetical protein
METYTEDEMNAAIVRVESAKKIYPIGWHFLAELNLPADELVDYTFANAHAHLEQLDREEDRRIIYSVGWLNGVGIGVALGEGRNGSNRSSA